MKVKNKEQLTELANVQIEIAYNDFKEIEKKRKAKSI